MSKEMQIKAMTIPHMGKKFGANRCSHWVKMANLVWGGGNPKVHTYESLSSLPLGLDELITSVFDV